jgi:hypothetical protein
MRRETRKITKEKEKREMIKDKLNLKGQKHSRLCKQNGKNEVKMCVRSKY